MNINITTDGNVYLTTAAHGQISLPDFLDEKDDWEEPTEDVMMVAISPAQAPVMVTLIEAYEKHPKIMEGYDYMYVFEDTNLTLLFRFGDVLHVGDHWYLLGDGIVCRNLEDGDLEDVAFASVTEEEFLTISEHVKENGTTVCVDRKMCPAIRLQ